MKKVFAILAALILVLTMSSAMAEGTADAEGAFRVTLTGNPTTGYSWLHLLGDDTVAEMTEEYLTSADIDKLAGIESNANEMITGEGGLYVFTVKGLKPGTTVLAFQYGQEWDESSTVAGLTFTLKVNEDLSVVATACMMGI